MPFAIKFNKMGEELTFIGNESDLKSGLQSGFSYLIREFADDYDRGVEAEDAMIEMSAEDLKEYRFTLDARAYRSTLSYMGHTELPQEEYAVIFKHAEVLGLHCR